MSKNDKNRSGVRMDVCLGIKIAWTCKLGDFLDGVAVTSFSWTLP